MSKLEELLIGRQVKWVELEYDLDDGRTYTPHHFSGRIVELQDSHAIVQIEDNSLKPLWFLDLTQWLNDPEIRYAIARHFGALRKAERLANRTPHDIYALIDPRDNTIRYIGLSKQVGLRYNQHLYCSGDNERKNAWIQELQSHGLEPELTILEHVEGRYYAGKRENYWIQFYLEQGMPLTNVPEEVVP